MSQLDKSFEDKDVTGLNNAVDYSDPDDMAIPIKKLSDAFDTVATKTSLSSSEDGGMKVYLRVRPIADKNDSTVIIEGPTSILTNAPESSKRAQYTKTEERKYTFSNVFAPESTQEEVFDTVVQPMCDRFLGGDSCALIAYGMTSGGKTHTIQGSIKNAGIFPRLVSYLLKQSENNSESESFSLQLSILEIYQEKLNDLLAAKKEKLFIRDDGSGKIDVQNLSNYKVNSSAEANQFLDIAASKRTKSKTLLNAGSSRSHAVYTLTLTKKINNMDVSNVFQVIDLAGAERGNRAKGTVNQQKEASNINCSLMQLWRCLQAMRKKPTDKSVSNGRTNSDNMINNSMNIPFRESKLTHILMPQLCQSGLSGVAIITCINPQGDDYDETLSILGNASIACKITELADMSGRSNTAPQTHTFVAKYDKNGRMVQHRNSSLMSDNGETTGEPKKRSLESSLGGPVRKTSRHHTGSGTGGYSSKLGKNSTGSYGNTFHASSHSRKCSVVGSTAPGKLSSDLGELEHDDRESWNLKEMVHELRGELERVKEENMDLINSQLTRESEIRNEVVAAMEKHSMGLMEQLQELQHREMNTMQSLHDVTRSCKKVKRKQYDHENEIIQRDLKEAEEEMMRLKQSHEVEVSKLKQRIGCLETELDSLKKSTSTAAPTISIDEVMICVDDGPKSTNSTHSNSSARSNTSIPAPPTPGLKARKVIVQDNGVVIIPPKKSGSPGLTVGNNLNRSPLGPVHDGSSQSLSPIRLGALTAVVKKQEKALNPKKKGRKAKNVPIEDELDVVPTTIATSTPAVLQPANGVNNENIPSPARHENVQETQHDASIIDKTKNEPVTNTNMKVTKQPSVMRRLRSTFRII